MLMAGVSVLAQTVSRQNSYRMNDRLAGRQIVCPSFSETGSGLVWDISQGIEASNNEEYTIEYTAVDNESEEPIAATEQNTRYLYRTQGDSLLICGFENHTTRVSYDQPEAYLRFPLHYGDSIEGYFHGLGKYCDRLGMRHYGRYKTKADATGVVVLAEGDTLRNVIRLHTERTMAAEMMPIELLDSLSTYTQDSIDLHIAVDTALVRMDIYRWYAEGYRYPVLETRVRRDGSGEQVLAEAAYYYPPSALASISYDPGNEESRTRANGTGGQDKDRGNTDWADTEFMTSRTSDKDAASSSDAPESNGLYSIDGRQLKEGQTVRNGIYLKERQQGANRSVKKVTVKNN